MASAFDVAIVGGGAAGIAAARRLHGSALSIVLLESLPRLGGRAHTISHDGLPLDLGAGWLHSADRNPWVAIAEAEGFTLDRTLPSWRRQYAELGFSREAQAEAADAYRRFGDRLRRDPPASDVAADALEPGGRWNAYLNSISGALNGAELSQVSATDFIDYEDAVTDGNWRIREGVGAAVTAAMPAVETRLDTKVKSIRHGGAALRLDTSRGAVDCRAAIVTLSTAALAAETIRFVPALDDKTEAAAQLPLGHVEKLFLAVEGAQALAPDTHLIGDPHRSDTGHYYLRPFGSPVIEGFFGGAAADAIRAGGMAEAADVAIEQLAALLGNDWRRRLRPVAFSGWSEVASIGGAYSHALPGQAEARRALARAVEGRIHFAGEACSVRDYSTVHGAYRTGRDAAEAVLGALATP